MFIVPRASSVYGAVRDTSESGAWSETAGFVKVVTRLGGRLLGAAIVGPHAGELIHEYTLALTKKMNITELSRVIHIYPTLSQVADERMKQKLTPTAEKTWCNGYSDCRGPRAPRQARRIPTPLQSVEHRSARCRT